MYPMTIGVVMPAILTKVFSSAPLIPAAAFGDVSDPTAQPSAPIFFAEEGEIYPDRVRPRIHPGRRQRPVGVLAPAGRHFTSCSRGLIACRSCTGIRRASAAPLG
jgi:hypothetical protein